METFADHWLDGTAVISGSGDAEKISFGSGQNRSSIPYNIGSGNHRIEIDKYGTGSGTPSAVEYKTGATYAACVADSWTAYDDGTGFSSLGWAMVRITA